MKRKCFTWAMGLSMVLIVGFRGFDVYAPAAAKDPLKTTLQRTLKKMPCEDTTKLINSKFLSSDSIMSEKVQEDASRAKAGTCEQEKEFLYSYISQQLPFVSEGRVGTKSWFSVPPAACLSCAASVCLAHDQCAKCCRKRHTTFCYECPR